MIKKLLAVVLIFAALATQVSAFKFPTPDWGALLDEKTKMVTETDFELYTEGPVEAAPFYGARLEPRGGAYFGMVAETSLFLPNVSSYLTYFDMSSGQTDIYYPANQIISQSSAVIDIGYTVSSLSSINYDTLRRALDNIASYNKPTFIRFASEMNVSSLGDEPSVYIDVFRRVADMIHEYPNLAVVWSPNDLGALDRPFSYYYPGDEYVDWVGVSTYGKKYFQGKRDTADKDARYFMTGDYAWTTNALKPIIKFMQDNNINKPLMIGEGGVSTENKHGDDLDAWASARFRNFYFNTIMKYPQLKAVNYFNTYRQDEAEKYYVADEIHAPGKDKEYAKYIMTEASMCGAYIKEGAETSEFVFEPAANERTLTAKDGVVNLYTLAHFPKNPYVEVTYKLDGVWYHSAQAAPYKCGLGITGLSDGLHTLEISSNGVAKAYKFYKQGNAIRFGTNPPDAPKEPVPGDVIGAVYNTDIVAYINNYAIPSYAANGTSVVVAEDLANFGFNVVWDGEARTLSISRSDVPTANEMGYAKTEQPSTFFSDIYFTDIKVYANGVEIPAYAINGVTMIPVESLTMFGECVWSEAERALFLSIANFAIRPEKQFVERLY